MSSTLQDHFLQNKFTTRPNVFPNYSVNRIESKKDVLVQLSKINNLTKKLGSYLELKRRNNI